MTTIKKKIWPEYFEKAKDGKKITAIDSVFGFAIIKVINLTALSVCRDGGFYFYE